MKKVNLKVSINTLIKKHEQLKSEVKRLKKEKDEISNILKTEVESRNNSITTKEYNVILQMVSYERLAGLKEVVKFVPRETLEPCINIVESKKLIVNKK